MIVLYKDERPTKTICKIKKLLKKLGIKIQIERFWCSVPGTVSVRVYLKSIPTVGTNGKGNNYEEALASALGELMERLQNSCLYKLPYYYNNEKSFYYAPDEVRIGNCGEILEGILEECEIGNIKRLIDASAYKELGVPYYSIGRECVQVLPIAGVNNLYGSNGMCAGNNFYEAAVNGMCEILERYACRQILRERIVLPTVSECGLNLCKENLRKLEAIRERFHVELKDCSLSEGYPIIGIYIEDKKEKKYILKIAAHPVIDIAVSKVINEVMQGNSLEGNSLFRSFSKNYNYYERIEEILKYGIAPYYDGKREEVQISQNFYTIGKNISNKELFIFVSSLVEKKGYEILIRDVSFLGFPSFHIIVPHMSEIYDYEDISSIINRIEQENEFRDYIIDCLRENAIISRNQTVNLFDIFDVEYGHNSPLEVEIGVLYNLVVSLRKGKTQNAKRYISIYQEWLIENGQDELYVLYNQVLEWLNGEKSNKRVAEYIKALTFKEIPKCFSREKRSFCSTCIYAEQCPEKRIIEIHSRLEKIYEKNCPVQGKEMFYQR